MRLRCGCSNSHRHLEYDVDSDHHIISIILCESCGASWQLGEVCASEVCSSEEPYPAMDISDECYRCYRCGFIDCSCIGGPRDR